jgi:hypothetical protein
VRRLRPLHGAEGFVDVGKAALFGDHAVENEPALAVEIEIERDVIAEAARAMREVCTLHSGWIAIHGNSIIASGGNTPTIVAVPRTAKLSIAWRTRLAKPTASKGMVDAGAAG